MFTDANLRNCCVGCVTMKLNSAQMCDIDLT
jgi:hypothetical protein